MLCRCGVTLLIEIESHIACDVAGVVSPTVLAGQMMSLSSLTIRFGNTTNAVLELRQTGISPRSAARAIFFSSISSDHLQRAI